MKKVIGCSATVMAAMLFVCSGWANAKQICLSFDGSTSAYNLNTSAYPAKNHCKPISMTAVPTGYPAYLASGSMCLASDGDTLLLSLSDGYFTGLETLQATVDKSTGSGNWNDCVVHAGDSTPTCYPGPIFFIKCSHETIPAATPDAAALSSQSSSSLR